MILILSFIFLLITDYNLCNLKESRVFNARDGNTIKTLTILRNIWFVVFFLELVYIILLVKEGLYE